MDELKNHANLKGHKTSMTFYSQKKFEEGEKMLAEINHVNDDDYRAGTIRNLKTAYTIGLKDLSYNSHISLVNLQKSNGIAMGSKCTGKDSCKYLSDTIADQDFNGFLASLKASNSPWSLIW